MARNSFGMKLILGVVKAISKANKVDQKRKPKAARESQSATKECPRCHYYFRSAVCPYCTDDTSTLKEMDCRGVSDGGGVAKATDFLPPIPQGYQIYKRMLMVAGISFRKYDASLFIRGSCQTLEFEREPNNPKDKNAIKVIGVTPTSRYFVGYVPKEISKLLVTTCLLDKVKPRLDRTYHGIKDYVEIRFQIIGLKENKKQFDAFYKNKPADAEQKMFFKFFELPIPRGLTTEQAKQIIKEHCKKLEAQDVSLLKEYDAYLEILEEFGDSDFRKEYEVKKPSMDILNGALDKLRQQGHTYTDLCVNIQDVVDMVIKLKPELARANNDY